MDIELIPVDNGSDSLLETSFGKKNKFDQNSKKSSMMKFACVVWLIIGSCAVAFLVGAVSLWFVGQAASPLNEKKVRADVLGTSKPIVQGETQEFVVFEDSNTGLRVLGKRSAYDSSYARSLNKKSVQIGKRSGFFPPSGVVSEPPKVITFSLSIEMTTEVSKYTLTSEFVSGLLEGQVYQDGDIYPFQQRSIFSVDGETIELVKTFNVVQNEFNDDFILSPMILGRTNDEQSAYSISGNQVINIAFASNSVKNLMSNMKAAMTTFSQRSKPFTGKKFTQIYPVYQTGTYEKCFQTCITQIISRINAFNVNLAFQQAHNHCAFRKCNTF